MISNKVIKQLQKVCGKKNVLTSKEDILLYQYDASIDKSLPDCIIFPKTTENVANVVKIANKHKIPVVARGSGTNLSGGTIAKFGGIILSFSKMNNILEIDVENKFAIVEPGVFNLDLQNKLNPLGFCFAPDPASQKVSTIGGNVAENAGGPHCLKYGVTSNHILGLEAVLADGSIREIGGRYENQFGCDLTGILVGSEGTLAIITKIIVKIIPLPESVKTMLAIFSDMNDAASAVTEIIAQGIVPASLEMMDRPIIQTVESSLNLGYPENAEAILIIELDGPQLGIESETKKIIDICSKHKVNNIKVAENNEERDDFWTGRRASFGTLTKLRPSTMIADGTVPRTKLPEVLADVIKICEKYGLQIGNVFHAGDGNLHPFILYDERNNEEKEQVLQATHEILKVCVDAGGTISGEHGIGLEKKEAMKLLFSQNDMNAMKRVKQAFDFDNIFNPGKIFPLMKKDNS